MKYTTYIFDFDYTLCDATVGIVACVNFALGELGFEAKDCEDIRKTIGMTLENMFSSLTDVSDTETAGKFFSHFMSMADEEMTDNTVMIPGAISVLSQLKEKGFNTAIVTTKVRYRVEEILRKYNIVDLIDIVIGYEDVAEPKPSPEGLLKAIDYFKCGKKSVLFIGDSLIDANTANNAEVDFAAVLTGTTTKQDFLALPSICILNTLTEILEFCKGID